MNCLRCCHKGIVIMKESRIGSLSGGFVYIMSNPSMIGYFKVGRTSDLERRRSDLSRETSSPLPFVCEYAIYTPNPTELERHVHQRLERFRVPKKEFFRIDDLEDLISELQIAFS